MKKVKTIRFTIDKEKNKALQPSKNYDCGRSESLQRQNLYKLYETKF